MNTRTALELESRLIFRICEGVDPLLRQAAPGMRNHNRFHRNRAYNMTTSRWGRLLIRLHRRHANSKEVPTKSAPRATLNFKDVPNKNGCLAPQEYLQTLGAVLAGILDVQGTRHCALSVPAVPACCA